MKKKDQSEVTRLLKKTTHLTAREWMIARLCADFKNSHGHSEMTWIGQNLPVLVPFFNEPYSRQEVSSARSSFKNKLERSGTTLFYSLYSGLVTKEELIDMIHDITKNINTLKEMEEKSSTGKHDGGMHNLAIDILELINRALEE